MCSVSAPVTRSFDAKAIASTGSADGSLLPGLQAGAFSHRGSTSFAARRPRGGHLTRRARYGLTMTTLRGARSSLAVPPLLLLAACTGRVGEEALAPTPTAPGLRWEASLRYRRRARRWPPRPTEMGSSWSAASTGRARRSRGSRYRPRDGDLERRSRPTDRREPPDGRRVRW